MRVLKFPTPSTAPHRYRSIIISLLLLLCIPIFVYHIVPGFTRATDELLEDLATRIRGDGFCTKEVGSRQCCALFLEAAPCVDECRKKYVDRETWMLTREYEECAEKAEKET
jgi:hypothetical protein